MSFFHNLFARKQGAEKAPECTLPEATFLVLADFHTWMVTESDWASLEELFEADPPDAVLLLGDILPEDAARIARMANGTPCLYVLGNHDLWHQYDGIEGLQDLDGAVTEIRGIRLAGISGAPRYRDDPERVMRTQEEARTVAASLPAAEILISHESPYRMLNHDQAHEGFMGITQYIRKHNPALHLFGHHHIRHQEIVNGTLEVCVFHAALVRTENMDVQELF